MSGADQPKTLRARLLDELDERLHSASGYPTWWWANSSRRGDSTVAQARAELKRMEKEGIVRRASSECNQIQWLRVEGTPQVRSSIDAARKDHP